MAPNPHLHPRVRSAGFFGTDVSRLLSGWESSSNSIDHYLVSELRPLRARSRRMVRANPYGKRFISTIKSNVIGPNGVTVQAHTTRMSPKGPVLDTPANDAIEFSFQDWAAHHCDALGKLDLIDLENMALSCAAQDGEYIFQILRGPGAGKYGLQLRIIDPELLDSEKNTPTQAGEIRLGVEYDRAGRVVRYHFRRPGPSGMVSGSYQGGEEYSLPADSVIHGFIAEWPDQSRGIPWMHAGLERSKHLEKYDEAAIVKARSTAATMAVLKSAPGDPYTGEEDYGEDATVDQYDPGTIKDIGDRDIVQLDSDYPHQMYEKFVKSTLRGIASGLGISYHTLSNDLEGVNYSSIRTGVLEDREIFTGLQNWFIRGFMRPIYREFVLMAYTRALLRIGTLPLSRPVEEYYPAHFQGRRWAWVDPQKDGKAKDMAIQSRLTSRSQVIREMGGDPDTVWREWAREQEKLQALGIAPPDGPGIPGETSEDVEENDD